MKEIQQLRKFNPETGQDMNIFPATKAKAIDGVDDTPTSGSDNLVKSGGVADSLNDLDYRLSSLAGSNNTRITALEESVTTNTSDISELKTKVSINKSDISDLKENVASNTSEIGTINTKFAAIEKDVQNNQSSILRLDEEKATRQELQNTAQGLEQSISSVGALAGSNNSKINALQESVATNSNDISELKEGKANYTDIVDGTIIAAHALLADNAASANNAKNAQFAAEAGKAMQSDTAKLATVAQTANNIKATNIEGILSKDQLPAYPTAETMEITDHRNSTVWQDVINGNSVGEAISKLDSNIRIVKNIIESGGLTETEINNLKTELKEYIDNKISLKAVEDDDDNPITDLGFSDVSTEEIPDISNILNS